MMTVPTKAKLNNKGATLIELIVILAIIALFVSGSIVAFTILNSSNLKQATRTTKSYLETTRTKTMSVMADEWYFMLRRDDDNYFADVYKVYSDEHGNQTEEMIETKDLGVRITAALVSDGTEVDIDDGDELKIKYTQTAGSVSTVELNDAEYTPTDNMVSVKFYSGSKEAVVDLYFVSGKVEIHD